MKKVIVIAVMFFTGFVFVGQSFGGCKRTGDGYVYVHYDYKEKGKENYRKNYKWVGVISAQGVYGASCTPVRIKKAKNRAADEVKKIVRNKYEGKAIAQQNALCSKVPNNIRQIAQYFQIDYLEVYVHHKNTAGYIKKFRIPAANALKFHCN